MITLKMIWLEESEDNTEADADIVVRGKTIVKDRPGVLSVLASMSEGHQEKREIAAKCLAGMMANGTGVEDDGLTGKATFADYGNPEQGAARACTMAEALVAEFCDRGWYDRE